MKVSLSVAGADLGLPAGISTPGKNGNLLKGLIVLSGQRLPSNSPEMTYKPLRTDARSDPAGEQRCCGCPGSPPACPSRGRLLLHCFLQGLKAGLSEGTDARHQVAMQLLHSEWEYVSTLNQLYDKYKTPPAHQTSLEPYQTYVRFVEQLLQRHVLFRNTLQERLSAEHWKSLLGDILVQLIGQNDTAFSDMYLGYTTTLASFLSLEFQGLNRPERSRHLQGGQMEREEMKLLSLLLAPLARVHGYLSHIQNLLQWTGKEHPDCSLLLGAERALRSVLSRCHQILQEDVRWEDGDEPRHSGSCDAAVAGSTPAGCCPSQQARDEPPGAAHRDGPPPPHLTNMRLECWSCSPVRRKGCRREPPAPSQPGHHCGQPHCSLLTPDTSGWAENSDSGQGTFSQATAKYAGEPEAPRARRGLADLDTDPDDTSAFDYSSVTSGSPDGTLRREADSASGEAEGEDEEEEEEEEEEDSQVLLPYFKLNSAGAAQAVGQPAGSGIAVAAPGQGRLREVADPQTDPAPPAQEPCGAVRRRADAVPHQLPEQATGQRQEGLAAAAPEKCLQAHLGRPVQAADGLGAGEGQPARLRPDPGPGEAKLPDLPPQQGNLEAGADSAAGEQRRGPEQRRIVGQRGQRGALQHRLTPGDSLKTKPGHGVDRMFDPGRLHFPLEQPGHRTEARRWSTGVPLGSSMFEHNSRTVWTIKKSHLHETN
ncbi:uncharacterized protein si:ch211-67f24.7 [Cololabis saira]|uniref:uncharacterized protein si:ch211-67f24.7 n=1 Tax=Cololabis saira TaxID=129043 RepID=UPI002AD2F3B3|nr:uncharacterized protein si:ch211-67f24.7 [Cololabis saira]